MTNSVLAKRVAKLEAEIRQIKIVLPRLSRANQPLDTKSASFKKLPRGVQAGLRDIAAGRVSGPFDTVEALIADLES